MAMSIQIEGFSDKVFAFAEIYIKLLLTTAQEKDGFRKSSIKSSIEKIRTEYSNNNNEVGDKASHNRLLMLIPHSFHDKLMEKELQEQ